MGQGVFNKHMAEGGNQADCGKPPQASRNRQLSISERTNMGVGDVRKVSAVQTLKTGILDLLDVRRDSTKAAHLITGL